MRDTGSILVIDNEPTIVDLLVELLTNEGYVAYGTADGTGVLAAIARHAPALLLLDVRRPSMDGAQMIAEIHRACLTAVPIVLLTTAPLDAKSLLVPGSIDLLAKPFDIDELLACVARFVLPDQALDRRLAPCAP
jgi:DNA-binding response OmpR family regulator